MIITKVRLIGASTVDLPIVGALPSDPYVLKAADGFGPTQNDINLVNTLRQGGVYQGRRPQLRVPVMRVGFNANWGAGQTPESLRTALYSLLSPAGDRVTMQLMNGVSIVAQCFGYIEKIEPAIFAKDPEAVITLQCTQSYFEALNDVQYTPDVYSGFVINNQGTDETGFALAISMATSATSLTLTKTATNEKMLFTHGFLAGDILRLNTEAGFLRAELERNGGLSSLLLAMSADSKWLQLNYGVNSFSFSNPNAINTAVFTYLPKFAGI
jgi:hypothetical protein